MQPHDSQNHPQLTRSFTHSGKPVIGNLLDIPPQHSWLKFKTWADEYGPVFRLNIMGRNHVVVSNETIANDLLRERGNLYCIERTVKVACLLERRPPF